MDRSLEQVATKLSARPPSLAALQALRAQNSPPSPAQEEMLRALEEGRAVCAFSGQQLGLCLGPLLTFYKMFSVIRWAKDQQLESGKTIVPIFWVQSEDHDLAEVDTLTYPSPDGVLQSLRVFPADTSQGNRRSIGAIALPESIHAVLDALEAHAGTNEHVSLFRKHYRPGVGFAEAFTAVARELFGPDGLLFFNPRDMRVAPLLSDLYLRALDESAPIHDDLVKQTEKLREAGVEGFVHLRSRSPLFFYHPEGADGPRYRVQEIDPKMFEIPELQQEISREDLKQQILQASGNVSSSALLRPLLQNYLFPTLAYIGGPAELRYWRQIEPLHQRWNIPFPLLVPRVRILLVETKMRRMIEQLNLNAQTLELDLPRIKEKILAELFPPGALPSDIEAFIDSNVQAIFAGYLKQIEAFDPSISNELSRSSEKVTRAIQGFLDKLHEIAERKAGISLERLDRLGKFIAPSGVPQERICAFSAFWCKYGPQLFDSIRSELEKSSDDFLLVTL